MCTNKVVGKVCIDKALKDPKMLRKMYLFKGPNQIYYLKKYGLLGNIIREF